MIIDNPTISPSISPTKSPSNDPTISPTNNPTKSPSNDSTIYSQSLPSTPTRNLKQTLIFAGKQLEDCPTLRCVFFI